MIKSRNIEQFTIDGDEDKKEYRIDELFIDNDEGSEENDKIKTITVSLVDTQVDGGYVDMKFPIPGKLIDIIQGKSTTFNGFKIDDDPEQKTYDVSVIERTFIWMNWNPRLHKTESRGIFRPSICCYH